jgi:hypothetical protein
MVVGDSMRETINLDEHNDPDFRSALLKSWKGKLGVSLKIKLLLIINLLLSTLLKKKEHVPYSADTSNPFVVALRRAVGRMGQGLCRSLCIWSLR